MIRSFFFKSVTQFRVKTDLNMSLLIVISSDDLIQLNPRLGSIAELIGLLSSAMLVRNYSSSRQDIHGNGVG